MLHAGVISRHIILTVPAPCSAVLISARWKGESMAQTVTLGADDTVSAFAAALAQALRQLDHDGRLTAANARLLRRAIAATPRAQRLGVAVEPERYLGAFGGLPSAAQAAIVQAIKDSDRWCMAGYGVGDWHFAMSRWLHASHARLRHSRWGPWATRFTARLMQPVRRGPVYGLQAAYQRRLLWQGQFAVRPTLAAMLAVAQLEPWHFAICYAQGVPQQAAFRGFWHDPAQHNTVGVMLGLDLLPSATGWWFLESNLSSALRAQRAALYHRDPFVTNLLAFVRAKGYQHLIMIMPSHINERMAQQFEDSAAAQQIRLTILENPQWQKTTYRQSYGVPPLKAGGTTLVVRVNRYRTSLDQLLHHKLATSRALAVYNRRLAAPTVLLPSTDLHPLLDKGNLDEPFPNLVYKLPASGQGQAVMFLKAMSLEHARGLIDEAQRLRPPDRPLARGMKRLLRQPESPDGIFQPYVRSAMLPGRHLYIVRAHVLLTPSGTHFLSAHRVVSGSPVPEHLPPGLVQNPTPYLVNFSSGARYELVPPEEEPAVVAAALAVADGLSWAAAYSFQTRGLA